MNTWMFSLMMMMMTTPLSDLVKTRKEQSASTSSLLGDDGLGLIYIRTWLDNGFALYYDEREHGDACRQRSTVRRFDLDKEGPEGVEGFIQERDGEAYRMIDYRLDFALWMFSLSDQY